MNRKTIFYGSLILLLAGVASRKFLEYEYLTITLYALGAIGMVFHFLKGRVAEK